MVFFEIFGEVGNEKFLATFLVIGNGRFFDDFAFRRSFDDHIAFKLGKGQKNVSQKGVDGTIAQNA